MAFSEFVLTDGTVSIDFLAANKHGAGIAMTRYTPGRANLKGGGVWQDSPLARGRRLAHGVKANISDAVEFSIAHSNHRSLIAMQQDLDSLLEKAIAYWLADWQDEPVYIKARAAGENNPRYAVVYSAEFPNYPDPYQEPYNGRSKRHVMEGMILGLERGDWMDNPPGTGTAIEISNDQNDVTTDPIYVIGHYKSQALTAIYYEADNVNKINTLPLTLFDVGDADDAVYFGSPQPFSVVAFNIGTAMASSSHTIEWEYSIPLTVSSSGSVWGSVSAAEDGTNGFRNTGPSLVRWLTSDDGPHTKYTLVVGQNLYWLRARISAVSGLTVLPIEASKQVFIPTLSYVELDEDQIGGDINALVRIRCQMDINEDLDTAVQNVMVGSRSLERGEDFTAYVNMDNNPAGISITLPDGATLDSADEVSVTGTSVGWGSPDVTAWEPVVQIEIDSSIAQQYFGRYRLFVQQIADAPSLTPIMRSFVYWQDTTIGEYGEAKPIGIGDSTQPGGMFDLGYIQLPPSSAVSSSDDSHTFVIELQAKAMVGTTVYFVILLPVDEFAVQMAGQSPDAVERYNFDIDSIGYPKVRLRGIMRLLSNDHVAGTFQVIGHQEASLATNRAQRLWFVFSNEGGNGTLAAAVSVTKNERFHHLRSD